MHVNRQLSHSAVSGTVGNSLNADSREGFLEEGKLGDKDQR